MALEQFILNRRLGLANDKQCIYLLLHLNTYLQNGFKNINCHVTLLVTDNITL